MSFSLECLHIISFYERDVKTFFEFFCIFLNLISDVHCHLIFAAISPFVIRYKSKLRFCFARCFKFKIQLIILLLAKSVCDDFFIADFKRRICIYAEHLQIFAVVCFFKTVNKRTSCYDNLAYVFSYKV